MRRINFILYLSIIALVMGGLLFVKANRHESTVKIIENLKDKDIVFYSSNYKRAYINFKGTEVNDMERLCAEGANNLRISGLNSLYFRIDKTDLDPYTASGVYLDRNLNRDRKYILIDISRGQSKHGAKYQSEGGESCPISIRLSKKSKGYDQSLLFAGRVKAIIDKKYEKLPVSIITVDDQDYNQSKGYIGMLVELGDAANTYDEARESMKVLCDAIEQVVAMTE